MIRKQVFQSCATGSYWYRRSLCSTEAPAGWGKHETKRKETPLPWVDLRTELLFVLFFTDSVSPLGAAHEDATRITPIASRSGRRVTGLSEQRVTLVRTQPLHYPNCQLAPSLPRQWDCTPQPHYQWPFFWARGGIQPSEKPGRKYNPFPLRDHISAEEWWVLFKHCKRIHFSWLSRFI